MLELCEGKIYVMIAAEVLVMNNTFLMCHRPVLTYELRGNNRIIDPLPNCCRVEKERLVI